MVRVGCVVGLVVDCDDWCVCGDVVFVCFYDELGGD